MTMDRFWVIGGDYASLEFDTMRSSPRIEGPFATHDEARSAWKRLSEQNSSIATTRFTIASERFSAALR